MFEYKYEIPDLTYFLRTALLLQNRTFIFKHYFHTSE